mmetsp:Transcript_126536/g.316306  ORF Transcript_126536/g.316306 Transcript_126536/m.316306 type:complete len:297 (+) Transcript_126536:125-1015(+)
MRRGKVVRGMVEEQVRVQRAFDSFQAWRRRDAALLEADERRRPKCTKPLRANRVRPGHSRGGDRRRHRGSVRRQPVAPSGEEFHRRGRRHGRRHLGTHWRHHLLGLWGWRRGLRPGPCETRVLREALTDEPPKQVHRDAAPLANRDRTGKCDLEGMRPLHGTRRLACHVADDDRKHGHVRLHRLHARLCLTPIGDERIASVWVALQPETELAGLLQANQRCAVAANLILQGLAASFVLLFVAALMAPNQVPRAILPLCWFLAGSHLQARQRGKGTAHRACAKVTCGHDSQVQTSTG